MRISLICMSLCGAAISAASEEALSESTKPNILVLIADDAGMDFGCYGKRWDHNPEYRRVGSVGTKD